MIGFSRDPTNVFSHKKQVKYRDCEVLKESGWSTSGHGCHFVNGGGQDFSTVMVGGVVVSQTMGARGGIFWPMIVGKGGNQVVLGGSEGMLVVNYQ